MGLIQNLKAVVRFEKFETDPVARRLAHTASIDDLRAVARRRLPRGVFDYVDGGAEDERTLAANRAAFAQAVYRPRVLRNINSVDISSTLFDAPMAYPLALAPTGFTRIVHPDGELAVARAAAAAGLPYSLSTLSTCSIEEVRAVSDGRLWFQVYAWRDRGLVKELVDRSKEARYEALVLTVDTAVLGRRERDVRRGFALPPRLGPSTFVDGALHPQWTWSFLKGDPIRFANVVGREGRDVGDAASPVVISEYISTQFDPALSWSDVEWLQGIWSGPIVLKGVQSVEDAKTAADLGVTAVALSNHGGRQLDGSPAPFSLVAPVRDAVGDRTALICDGGIRRGSDIVKAVAAGADACMAGRAYLYALAAGAERGVDLLLTWFANDMVRTMTLLGVPDVAGLDRSILATNPALGLS
ncbi:MAG TPA: alpha-hydroxy acid oxidase [Acidimicrobiales bacterium]